jgi:hypothetical protein
MKINKWAVVALLAVVLPLFSQERAKEMEEKKRQEELVKMEALRAKLAELESRLHVEKSVIEEQAKLAQEYAQRAMEMQRTMKESPEFKAQLAKLKYDLQQKLSLAGLYKDQFTDLLDDQLSEQNKQILKLEEECIKMSILYKETENQEKQQTIEKELIAKVELLFDLREAQREKEIKRMTQDLTEMKKKLDERRLQKNQIVKNRLEQLLGKKDDLEW